MLGRSTTYSTDIEDAGSALLGSAWGGVHAADTLPPAAHHLTCRVVNTASTDDGTNGVHWCACVEEGGRRYFNDPLGAAVGWRIRDWKVLPRLQPVTAHGVGRGPLP